MLERPQEVAVSVRLRSFVLVCAQLALLLVVFRVYRVEEPAFYVLAVIAFGGFMVSYWLPVAWKEGFFVAVSVAGSFFIAEPTVAAGVLAIALAVYGVARLRVAYRLRATVIVLIFAALMVGRGLPGETIPPQFWATVGAIFMFRLIIYLYDLKHMKEPPPFRHFAAYFLMLPNFYFLFFPVVDYQTMTKSFGRRDHAQVAQSGVSWIVRGTIHLLLYRVISATVPDDSPYAITTLAQLVEYVVLTYMLYLRVSGTFHIIIGMMHLFGYDLPETHRKYLLASSLNDFWRRINIYWKDFMVKVVYFPVFFRLRKGGPVRAQVVATALVFFVTWALHVYQYYWLSGRVHITLTDAAFWFILGALVIVNLLLELKARDSGTAGGGGRLALAAKTAGTFTLVALLWSMWSSPTFGAWFDLLTYWEVG